MEPGFLAGLDLNLIYHQVDRMLICQLTEQLLISGLVPVLALVAVASPEQTALGQWTQSASISCSMEYRVEQALVILSSEILVEADERCPGFHVANELDSFAI